MRLLYSSDNKTFYFSQQKCNYCNFFTKHRKPGNKGISVKCESEPCKTTFHVTCGQNNGCKFDLADWPSCVYILCDKHACNSEIENLKKVNFRVKW